MIDPERLAAFALMTGATSLVPGMSMLFVMAQTVSRGWRGGAAALAGMQIGYVVWWMLAALGLGTLAKAFPLVFAGLAIAGAGYLAWLGMQAIRHSGSAAEETAPRSPKPSTHAFRDGILVAMGNPKSLVYMVALLPPFIDPRSEVVPQIVVLAAVSLVIDVAVGALYIGAGKRLAAVMHKAATRRRIDIVVGTTYLLIAGGILVDMALP